MAKAAKPSPKKAAKKSSGEKSPNVKPPKKTSGGSSNKPIKISLEISLKDGGNQVKSLGANLLGETVAPTIAYTFDPKQITVLKLSIENKNVQKPNKTGSIELDFVPPSGMISVSSMATGQGTGSLQLTYNGKSIFTQPVDFNFTNGIGFINETPKLP